MNALRSVVRRGAAVLVLAVVSLWAAGCQQGPVIYPPIGGPAGNNGSVTNGIVANGAGKLRPGDRITLIFSGIEPPMPNYEDRVKEDGTISPPDILRWVAAGKTPGELQTELNAEYKKYYTRLNVTVSAGDRYYYVSGDVKNPGPKLWLGETDIVSAIAAAGDFTEFADRKNVQVTRADGRVEVVNVVDVLRDPETNQVATHPGDKIHVPRASILWPLRR